MYIYIYRMEGGVDNFTVNKNPLHYLHLEIKVASTVITYTDALSLGRTLCHCSKLKAPVSSPEKHQTGPGCTQYSSKLSNSSKTREVRRRLRE
jgi:hypothetical protein